MKNLILLSMFIFPLFSWGQANQFDKPRGINNNNTYLPYSNSQDYCKGEKVKYNSLLDRMEVLDNCNNLKYYTEKMIGSSDLVIKNPNGTVIGYYRWNQFTKEYTYSKY